MAHSDSNPSSLPVTVVMVNWNGGDTVIEALRALAELRRPARRVVVVDNDSADGSAERIEEAFPWVTLVRAGANLGFAVANNLAVREYADTEWVALLNPDAMVEPEWLDALMGAAEDHPEYAFFGCQMISAREPSKMDGTGDCYHVSGVAWRRDFERPRSEAHLEADEIFAPCAAAALYRREAFLEVGGFDEDFFCYFEDVDLGFRLRLAGHRCRYVPESVVHHVGSASTEPQSDFSIYHCHRNLVWSYLRNMPAPLFWRYLPQHLLLNLMGLLVLTREGHGGAIFRAKWDAFRGLFRALRKRRSQQSRRSVSSEALLRVMKKDWRSPYRGGR